MATLPLITIRAPWPWAIFHAGNRKRFENRQWYSSHVGPLLVHCAAQAYEFAANQEWLVQHGQGCPIIQRHHCGHIIGVVDQIDCQRPAELLKQSEAANIYVDRESEWCHVYANAWAFRVPVPFRSRQGKHIRVTVQRELLQQLALCKTAQVRSFLKGI